MGDDNPVHHYEPTEVMDLISALDAAGIEYLEVDEHRVVAIYRDSVIILNAVEGGLTAAEAFEFELWEAPPGNRHDDPDDLLVALREELLAIVG